MTYTRKFQENTRLIIIATNISQGGGKTLLVSLLKALPKTCQVLALLDKRIIFTEKIPCNLTIMYFAPTILQRLRAQWWLFCNVSHTDAVLGFGSLPPLFKLKGWTSVFIQNRYIIQKNDLAGFPIKTMLRLLFEHLRLKLTSTNADEFIVQSPSMKAALISSGCVGKQLVHVRPFVSSSYRYFRAKNFDEDSRSDKLFDFIYVASGEPHKNHLNLIEAWCLLAEQNLFPSLCLTLDASVSALLCARIDRSKTLYGLDLKNVGFLPHVKILELYSKSKALIFPSKFESFGLPLIEARQAGLFLVASELDYVRDVLDPEETFDPSSPVSIARAVKRFMGLAEEPLPLLDGSEFLAYTFPREGQ